MRTVKMRTTTSITITTSGALLLSCSNGCFSESEWSSAVSVRVLLLEKAREEMMTDRSETVRVCQYLCPDTEYIRTDADTDNDTDTGN